MRILILYVFNWHNQYFDQVVLVLTTLDPLINHCVCLWTMSKYRDGYASSLGKVFSCFKPSEEGMFRSAITRLSTISRRSFSRSSSTARSSSMRTSRRKSCKLSMLKCLSTFELRNNVLDTLTNTLTRNDCLKQFTDELLTQILTPLTPLPLGAECHINCFLPSKPSPLKYPLVYTPSHASALIESCQAKYSLSLYFIFLTLFKPWPKVLSFRSNIKGGNSDQSHSSQIFSFNLGKRY